MKRLLKPHLQKSKTSFLAAKRVGVRPTPRRLALGMLLSAIQYIANAQQIYPLTIGNRVPDLTIGYNFNDPSQKLKLSACKAPLILLNFFSSNCTSCLHDLKKLDSLQLQFGSSVKILNLTREDPAAVTKTFARHHWPFSPNTLWKADSILLKRFPYEMVPHHVWLDSSFTVQYITIGANATAQNISKFLCGEKMDLVTKSDLLDFDEYQPLWLEGNGRLYNHLQYYSFIMKDIEGFIGTRINRFSDKTTNTVGFRAINLPLLQWIKAAWEEYPQQTFENNNRVALEVADSTPFVMPLNANERSKWMEANAWCYRLSLPASKKADLFSIMQQDILRFFPYDIRVEKRKIPCRVLIRTSNANKRQLTGLTNPPSVSTGDSIVMNSLPWPVFLRSLNNYNRNSAKPFVDETRYTGNVDLHLNAWYTDIEKLKTELHSHGLDLIEAERPVDILVIGDKKEGSR